LSSQCHGGYTTTNQNFNNNNYSNNNNNSHTRNLNLIGQPTVISTGFSASSAAPPIQQQSTQVTAKIMWGNKIAINELREKEQAEKRQRGQPGRKQQN
jgi:hypothetical protein